MELRVKSCFQSYDFYQISLVGQFPPDANFMNKCDTRQREQG